jgi:glycosyltransferase involved in cell wall biosynthesis
LARREQACLLANEAHRSALESEGPFALVYERHSLWSFAPMEYARANNTPGLLEVNAPLIDEQAEYRGLVDRASAQVATERAFGAASALVAVSDGVAAYLQRFPAAQGKVHVVPNGVDPERFPPELRPSLPAAPGTFTIGFAGSMKPWHGLETLLQAFALFHRHNPASRLLLVGDGAGRPPLEADAFSRGLAQAVHFTGAVAPAEVPGLLASMDVGVAPYPKIAIFYFSPLKVYEYMAAALPVVASRVGQLEQLIEPEVNGLLVPPGDAPALAAGLERIRREPDLAARLGQAARNQVLRFHTWDGVVARIVQLARLPV